MRLPTRLQSALLALLLLPLCLQAAPPVIECRHARGGWMELLKGASLAKMEELAQRRSDAFETSFIHLAAAGATDDESNHGVLVAYNDTGWLLGVRLDKAIDGETPGGKYDLFLYIDTPGKPAIPHHLTLDYDDHGFTNKMVHNYMGAALILEEQRSRIRGPRVVQRRFVSDSHDYEPLKVDFNTFVRPGEGYYTTFFFTWGNFIGRLPLPQEGLAEWLLKIIRTTPAGNRHIWGTNPHPFSGWGVMRWPRVVEKIVDDMHRQSMTAGFARHYEDKKREISALWSVSQMEKFYNFLELEVPTYEAREPEADLLFLRTALDPLIQKNARLSQVSFTPQHSRNQPTVSSLPPAEKELIYAALPRLRYFNHDVDLLRRDFLLNALLGHPPAMPVLPEKEEDKPREADWEQLNAAIDNVAIDLDDVTY